MGALGFLQGHTVYIDASILIDVVEHHARYSALLQPLVDAAAAGGRSSDFLESLVSGG